MGNSESFLTPEKLQELEKGTHYNAEELKNLVSRYSIHINSADDNSEGIPLEEFLMIPEFCSCPVAAKLAAAYVDENNGNIQPEGFILLCSALSSKADVEEKYKLLFNSLDVNNEGSIYFDQLFSFFKSLVSPALPDDHISDVIINVLQRESLDRQGSITYEEFKQLISPTEVKEKMTVDLQLLS